MESEPFPGIAERLANADGLLLGLDFDGTLAPIDEDPDAPTIDPATRRSVERFVDEPDATVAVVSGRELADLRSRVGIDGMVYAGNHGLELDRGDGVEVPPDARDARSSLRRTLERLRERLDGIEGWEIEDKGLTATVHVRGVPPDRVDEVRSAVSASVQEATEARDPADGLTSNHGKQVFEIRPDVDRDKGVTMECLSSEAPDGWLTMYLGDDVTDEDAFSAIRPEGVGVLVGTREDTTATYRLPGQDAVAPFLNRIANIVFDDGGTGP